MCVLCPDGWNQIYQQKQSIYVVKIAIISESVLRTASHEWMIESMTCKESMPPITRDICRLLCLTTATAEAVRMCICNFWLIKFVIRYSIAKICSTEKAFPLEVHPAAIESTAIGHDTRYCTLKTDEMCSR